MIRHNDPKVNLIFVLSFWAVTISYYIILNLLPKIKITSTSKPPDYLQNNPVSMYVIFAVYLGLFVAFGVYDLLGKHKLNKSKPNLINYGFISFATLAMVFIDLLTVMATGGSFLSETYSNNYPPLWQEIFLHVLFPTACVAIVILISKYMKIEYIEKTPIGL